jgi:serine/threonine protein phosphatase PrpC
MSKIVAKSDVGLLRNNNEDYFFVDEQYGLIIVADGAGGHEHGEIASRLAVESCYQYLTREDYLEDTTDIPQTLMDSVTFANQQVIEHKNKHLPNSNMGTTLSIVHLGEWQVSFAWMGDSRVYLLDPEGKAVSQISSDHTLYQEMLDRGEVVQSYKKSILSRMLGNNPYTRPDGDSITVSPGHHILVCSDGYSDLVSDAKTIDAMAGINDLEAFTETLIEMAKGQGGRDNITVAVARID